MVAAVPDRYRGVSVTDVDVPVVSALVGRADFGWTFDRAVDACISVDRAWRELRRLPGLDTVLTAGSPRGVTEGLDDLVADTPDGVLLSVNRSWSIDDRRVNFQFGVEAAWEIKGGRLGRLYRNATYDGRTTEFWGSLDAVCGPASWVVWGVPNCGKGQPFQNARVGHGTAPARFHNVHVGVRG